MIMKVYLIIPDEEYRWCYYSDANTMDILEAGDLLRSKTKINIEDWEPIKIEIYGSNHKNELTGDLFFSNVSSLLVANEKAKKLIESQFGLYVYFLPLESVDDAANKYYAMVPSEYVPGLDVKKSKCRFYPDGIVFKDVEKYVFNKGVLSYPIFRLMQHAFRLKTNEPCDFCHSTSVYVLDEFVDFLLENHIAGVDFKELYDFKDELI